MYNLNGIKTLEILSQKNLDLVINKIIQTNNITNQRGLILTNNQIIRLINSKNYILKKLGRLEPQNTIIDTIIYKFYDSSYIDEDNYVDTIEELIEIFYIYQNEFDNKLTDDQIIEYMFCHFENDCSGSLELLRDLYFDKLKSELINGCNNE